MKKTAFSDSSDVSVIETHTLITTHIEQDLIHYFSNFNNCCFTALQALGIQEMCIFICNCVTCFDDSFPTQDEDEDEEHEAPCTSSRNKKVYIYIYISGRLPF